MNELYAWQRMRARRILTLLENVDPGEVESTLALVDSELTPALTELTADWPDTNPVRSAIVAINYDNWLRSKDF